MTEASRTSRHAIVLTSALVVLAVSMLVRTTALVSEVGVEGLAAQGDLRAFLTAADLVAGPEPADLYDLDSQFKAQQERFPKLEHRGQLLVFANPPFVAVALSPLAELSTRAAAGTVAAINLGLLALCCWMVTTFMAGRSKQQQRLVVLGILGFLPLWVCLWQGQLSLLLLAAALGSWLGLRHGWDLTAGLALAVLLVKPQLLPLPLLLLVAQGQRRMLLGLVIGAGIAVTLGLVVDPSALERWWTLGSSLLEGLEHFGLYPGRMFTIRSALIAVLGGKATGLVLLLWLGAAVGLVVALLATWSQRGAAPRLRGPRPVSDSEWAAALGGALLLSPHAYTHDLLLLVPAGAVLASRFVELPTPGEDERGSGARAACVACLASLWMLPWLPLVLPIPPGIAAIGVIVPVIILLSRQRTEQRLHQAGQAGN